MSQSNSVKVSVKDAKISYKLMTVEEARKTKKQGKNTRGES